MISLRHFVTSTFTDLSRPKVWMLRGSLLLVVLGLGAKGYAAAADSRFWGGEWTWTSVFSGVGWIAGFLVGALMRMFLKLSLVVAFAAAAVTYGLAKLGVVDVEFSEFGELLGAYGEAAKRQMADLQLLLEGFLPASVASGVGLASGVTQRPDWTPDGDE